jgi:hypothetical protein
VVTVIIYFVEGILEKNEVSAEFNYRTSGTIKVISKLMKNDNHYNVE